MYGTWIDLVSDNQRYGRVLVSDGVGTWIDLVSDNERYDRVLVLGRAEHRLIPMPKLVPRHV